MSTKLDDTGIGEAVTNDEPEAKPDSLDVGLTIRRGKVIRPRRCLLYGPPGVGKSTWAASAPDVIIIQAERGIDDMDVASFPIPNTWGEFMKQLFYLRDNDHAFKTVVIDTVDAMERSLLHPKVCKDMNIKSMGDSDFGKSYDRASTVFRAFTGVLDELIDCGLSVVLLAHSDVKKVDRADGVPYDKFVLAMHKTTGAHLTWWSDEVLFATNSVEVSVEKEFGKEKYRAVGGMRKIITVDQPYCAAKSRIELPKELPFPKVNAFQEYSKHWSKKNV